MHTFQKKYHKDFSLCQQSLVLSYLMFFRSTFPYDNHASNIFSLSCYDNHFVLNSYLSSVGAVYFVYVRLYWNFPERFMS
jgi:hypothetical protein